MESGLGSIHWLYGLQDYFEFSKDTSAKLFIDQLISVYFSDNKANSVKNLCLSDEGPAEDKLPRFNFYFKLLEEASTEVDFVETISIMRKRLPNTYMLDIFHKYGREEYDMKLLADAFSRGQVQSKIWLATELAKVKTDFDMIFVLAGWFGQITNYLDVAGIEYNKARIIDCDSQACEVSDKIFNAKGLEGYKVKAVEQDLLDTTWVARTGCSYNLVNYNTGKTTTEKSTPDLIINSSAEHFHEDWYYKFMYRPQTTDPLFVIQSNNLFDIKEHINAVHSLDEMKKKFPMTRLEYEGEIQLTGYKRFMLIGRP